MANVFPSIPSGSVGPQSVHMVSAVQLCLRPKQNKSELINTLSNFFIDTLYLLFIMIFFVRIILF